MKKVKSSVLLGGTISANSQDESRGTSNPHINRSWSWRVPSRSGFTSFKINQPVCENFNRSPSSFGMRFNATASYARLMKFGRLRGNYTPSAYGDVDDTAEMLHRFYHYDTDVADASDPRYQMSLIGVFLATFTTGFVVLCCMWTLNCLVMFRCFRQNCKVCLPSMSRWVKELLVTYQLHASLFSGQ